MLPDSHLSVYDKTECAFRPTHLTFHFEKVLRNVKEATYYHFAEMGHVFPGLLQIEVF